MAIDTRERRASITGIHLYSAGTGITNNATHDQEWRQESGYSYAGILAGGAGPPTAVPQRFRVLKQRGAVYLPGNT